IRARIDSSLRRREELLGSQQDVGWEDELASSTGALDATQIRTLAERFENIEEPYGSVSEWIDWGLGWLEEQPARLGTVLRPSRIVAVMGKALEGFESDDQKALKALQTIRQIMP